MREWIRTVKQSVWQNFSDIRQTFNHADIHKNLTIFDVGGNKYRIIAKVEFRTRLLFIKFVLTHKEYDNHKIWCRCEKE